jgi:two-component system LytT family response regulator
MKTFIVEDNKPSLEMSRKFIEEDNPELEIIGEASSLRESRAFLMNHEPELVLLDIEIIGGTSFDLLDEMNAIGKLHFDIIFITAFDTQEYLVKAIEFSALKYLKKPLNRHEFREAVLKALERHQNRETFLRQINLLIENTRNNSFVSSVIALPLTKGIIEMVDMDDILYVTSAKAVGHSAVFLSTSAAPLLCNRSIGHFKNLLNTQQTFFQVHESSIINVKAMRRFDPVERVVTMRDGTKIIASRRYARLLKDYLMKEEAISIPGELDNLKNWLHRLIGRRN